MNPYDDIIHLPHHVSKTRKRLSAASRAAQFSPFAALTGYDDAIRETARLTDSAGELCEDETARLDGALRYLADHLGEAPEVTVRYFVPDGRKSGGAYVRATGRVRRLDVMEQRLLLTDGTAIPFGRIYDISIGEGNQPEGSCIPPGDGL